MQMAYTPPPPHPTPLHPNPTKKKKKKKKKKMPQLKFYTPKNNPCLSSRQTSEYPPKTPLTKKQKKQWLTLFPHFDHQGWWLRCIRRPSHWDELHTTSTIITKTYLYNFDPLKPHFYIVKLGFAGVRYFSYFCSKHGLWVLVRTA